MRAINDWVIIERDQQEPVSPGGIIIPEGRYKPSTGIIVSPKFIDSACQLKAGDRVVFGKQSGHEITIEEKEYVLVLKEDIMVVL